MTRETMHATFGAAGQSVRVVVLDGCATDDLARALCDFVQVCVGTSPSITDAAARAFCLGFYGALADGESTARACSHGRAAMLLQATGDHEPLLYHRGDVDPWRLVLAEGASRASHAPELATVAAQVDARFARGYFCEPDDATGRFDHTLRAGVAPTRNALALLVRAGYPASIVADAERRAGAGAGC